MDNETFANLTEMAYAISSLRDAILFESQTTTDCLGPFAKEYLNSSLALLEQAEAQMRLTALFNARETAGNF